MKHKILHCVKKKINEENKKNVSLPSPHKSLCFPSFILLRNAIIRFKDIKLKFHYITPVREFFTTSKKKKKKKDKIRIKSNP